MPAAPATAQITLFVDGKKYDNFYCNTSLSVNQFLANTAQALGVAPATSVQINGNADINRDYSMMYYNVANGSIIALFTNNNSNAPQSYQPVPPTSYVPNYGAPPQTYQPAPYQPAPYVPQPTTTPNYGMQPPAYNPYQQPYAPQPNYGTPPQAYQPAPTSYVPQPSYAPAYQPAPYQPTAPQSFYPSTPVSQPQYNNPTPSLPKPQKDLYKAVNDGDLFAVQAHIQHHTDLNKQDSEGRTALFAACYGGNMQIVQALVEAGANTSLARKGGFYPF